MNARVWIKAGREKSLLRRHPWVFSGAIRSLEGSPQAGETVDLTGAQGEFLGRGAFSPTSQIAVRVWTWNPDEPIDPPFFHKRLEQALALRRRLPDLGSGDAFRWAHGESDGLPGLVVDRYADTLVTQFTSSGAERWREAILAALLDLSGAARIYERSDVEVRRLEGLPEQTGLLAGSPLPERLQITENGRRFWVDVAGGHKTGFYLDQRPNRLRLGDFAGGKEVLDCFCYTGGFSIYALMGGAAAVTAVDSSPQALAQAAENLRLNSLPLERVTFTEGDVFHVLRSYRDQGRSFDLVVLDPPKFAPTAAQAERAARGYKDINLLALRLLRPGGVLFTFSCSGGIDADLFQKIVAGAALDAGVNAVILERLAQGADHPTALNFPEGAYLKGLVVGVQ